MRGTEKDVTVGHAAQDKTLYTQTCPIERGIVSNWDDMERIWHHTFYNELRVAPEGHPVLLVEPRLNPKAHRERIAQIMFETFKVPALYVAAAPVLASNGTSNTTALVIQIEHDWSGVIPVYAGHALTHAAVNIAFTEKERILERERTLRLSSQEITKFVPSPTKGIRGEELDPKYGRREARLSLRAEELPDTYQDPNESEFERLFESVGPKSLNADKGLSVQDAVLSSLIKCDPDLHADLINNIVLADENRLPGCSQTKTVKRVAKEISDLLSEHPVSCHQAWKVKVIAPEVRKNNVWHGGSIVDAHLRDFWMTQEAYFENGPSMVHRYCF